MKSLNSHVCHILPPYGKACPHALKLLNMCPTMWLPTTRGHTLYKPNLPKYQNIKIPITYRAQASTYK